MIRSFIAVDLDDANVKRRLVAAQEELLATGADLKAVETENIHVTVRFLGDVRSSALREISDSLSLIEFHSFRAEQRGLGVFPSLNRPRVVWAGYSKGQDAFIDLYGRIESRLREFGVRPEDQRYHPHVTLVRVRSGRNRDALVRSVQSLSDESFGELVISRFQLKRSVLTPRGPIYSNVREYAATES